MLKIKDFLTRKLKIGGGSYSLNAADYLPPPTRAFVGFFRTAIWGRLGAATLLGVAAFIFLSTSSNEVVFPSRISCRAMSMMLKNSGLVLNASDSRSIFLSEPSIAIGRFFNV
jgi:hypothetical protein